MLGGLQGFTLIIALISLGFIAARYGVVAGDQIRVLDRVAFYVATPALIFSVLRDSNISVLISPIVVVGVLAAVATALLFVICSRLFFRKQSAETALLTASTGYVNSSHLGIPVAVYILGNAAYVAPLILVQLVLFSTALLAILEAARGNENGAIATLRRAVANPLIIASLLGFLFALIEIPVPVAVANPIEMLGAIAVPLVSLSLGMSFYHARAFLPAHGRAAILTASACKVLVMPLIAWLIGQAFGLSPMELFVTVVLAALPTAQNIYNYASIYKHVEAEVRSIVFITTFASIPVIALLTWWTSP